MNWIGDLSATEGKSRTPQELSSPDSGCRVSPKTQVESSAALDRQTTGSSYRVFFTCASGIQNGMDPLYPVD